MSSQRQNIHRRKSSKDKSESEESTIVFSAPSDPDETSPTIIISSEHEHEEEEEAVAPTSHIALPPRERVHSSPQAHTRSASTSHVHGTTPFPGVTAALPPSAGPYRTTFAPPPLPLPQNGVPLSPFRNGFGFPSSAGGGGGGGGHSRTRSVSTPFAPSSPSPLGSSFPSPGLKSPTLKSPTFPTSGLKSPTFAADSPALSNGTTSSSPPSTRRHSRLHSRNLSIFFPRPGSLPTSTIAETDSTESEDVEQGQELLIPQHSPPSNVEFPRRAISSPQPPTPLGAGFKFGGGRPPALSDVSGSRELEEELLSGPRGKRRGHHHKHSLSHNFFSFMEPGGGLGSAGLGSAGLGGGGEEMYTQPTPTPISPWAPISAIPSSAAPSSAGEGGFALAQLQSQSQSQYPASPSSQPKEIAPDAVVVGVVEFVLGAWLWVMGQQIGSLSLTGVGYWVVFDSFGVAVRWVLPGWLWRGKGRGRLYGNTRVETVFLFAQSVYLMFSSVYVCKETIEHLLLSADAGSAADGHHHHRGDEDELPIEFPIVMILITLLYVLWMGVMYENHWSLVDVSGNRIPSLRTIWRSIAGSRQFLPDLPPTTPLFKALSNPFVAPPLVFCMVLLGVALGVPAAQHRLADLLLAGLIAIVTFNVAYRACVVLGTVLLQTSPPRGMKSARMEGFLRVMREVERHPQVMHLPAPHIWQLTPSSAESTSGGSQSEQLVVTVQLHVKEELGDDEVIKLTRWAWERCVASLGGGEVTVGVVRG
ncbi:hypothetical protein BDQ17DRAFT_1402125 [Cyathus striatus]|nr:hypothetical protein BDQ17DRAFT_1402125 [Cyathus striatus]